MGLLKLPDGTVEIPHPPGCDYEEMWEALKERLEGSWVIDQDVAFMKVLEIMDELEAIHGGATQEQGD